jgi:hypothetical protein
MKRASVALLIALSLFGFACANRKPVVANELARSICIRSTWDDGKSVDGVLPPNGRAFLSDPPHHPQQVVISLPDGESYTFTRANAPDLIGQPVTGSIIGWRVTSGGVLPLLDGELKDSDGETK